MLDPIFKFFSSPFSQGVQHFANINDKQLNFKEKLSHFAFGFFEMIPLLNVCVLYIDKKLNEKKIIVIDLSDVKGPALPGDPERGIENKGSKKSPSTISTKESGEESNLQSSFLEIAVEGREFSKQEESEKRVESDRSLEIVIEDESQDKASADRKEETLERVVSDLALEVVVEDANQKTASVDDLENLEVLNPNAGRQSDQSSLHPLSELQTPASPGNDPILKASPVSEEGAGAKEDFDIEKQLDKEEKISFIDTAAHVGKVSIGILGLLFGAAFVGYSTYSLRSQQAEKDNGLTLYKLPGNSVIKEPLPVHNQIHHLNSLYLVSPSFYENFSGILEEDDPSPLPQDFTEPLEADQIAEFRDPVQSTENSEAKQTQAVPTSATTVSSSVKKPPTSPLPNFFLRNTCPLNEVKQSVPTPEEAQKLQLTEKGEAKPPEPIQTPAPIMDPPIQKPKNPSICLFTSYTSDNTQRVQLSKKVSANQQEYSKVRGYQYLEYPENLALEGSIKYEPYWSKIAGLNRILNDQEPSLKDKPDWIVWLDDDAIISNQNIKFEDVIAHYGGNEGINLIVTEDAVSRHNHNIPLNSAVLIVKNNSWSRKFFKKIWEMKDKTIPGTSHTYGNCKNQSCLHEQQAMADLLKDRPNIAKHVRIIPQRDPKNDWGINTFHRWSHYDLNREMNLYYNDPVGTNWQKNDFIGQCTGLATKALDNRPGYPRNIRMECVDQLIAETKHAEE